MWAIVIIALHALTGPQIRVVTKPAGEQHVYASEADCKAVLEADLPAKLQDNTRKQYEDGFRRYACVRIAGADALKIAQ